MKQTLLSFCFVLSLILGLQSAAFTQFDAGTYKNNVYKCKEIGWKIKIPKGWETASRQTVDRQNKLGKEMLENTLESEVDLSGLRDLIQVGKNPFNSLLSTIEPFELEYEGEWEENNAALKDVMLSTYTDQGIRAVPSPITYEEIDGVRFELFSFKILAPDGSNAVLLHQMMYSSLINGYDFGVIINYNDQDHGDEILAAFRKSKFK